MISDSLLLALQADVAARLDELRTQEGLQQLEILTESPGELNYQIQKRIQNGSGGFTILTPSFQAGEENPDEITVDVAVVYTERAALNTKEASDYLPAAAVAEEIFANLQRWQPTNEAWAPLMFRGWSLAANDESTGRLIYTALFKTSTITSIESD